VETGIRKGGGGDGDQAIKGTSVVLGIQRVARWRPGWLGPLGPFGEASDDRTGHV
jgi:hypothetical protein